MKHIDLRTHAFEKVNLATLKGGGDKYRCRVCGMTGIRPAFLDYVRVTEKESKKKCGYQRPKTKRPVMVSVDSMPFIGIIAGSYKVVDCPEEYKDKYSDEVWIYSEERGEAVRILSREINESFYE